MPFAFSARPTSPMEGWKMNSHSTAATAGATA
jgi:hypothetical protein